MCTLHIWQLRWLICQSSWYLPACKSRKGIIPERDDEQNLLKGQSPIPKQGNIFNFDLTTIVVWYKLTGCSDEQVDLYNAVRESDNI